MRQDFGNISGNAENGNKNEKEVFSNVTKQEFESKNEVSVQAYTGTRNKIVD